MQQRRVAEDAASGTVDTDRYPGVYAFDDPEFEPKPRGGRPPPLVHTVLIGLLCVPPVVVVVRLFYRSQEMPFPIGSPLWVVAGVVLALGVSMCFGSVVALLARGRRRSLRMWRRPPRGARGWLADHRWDARGARRTPLGRWWRSSSQLGFVLWLTWQPIYWFRTLWDSQSDRAIYVGMLIFALPLTWFAYRLLRHVMGGSACVTFVEPPYRPDRPIVVYFGLRGAGRADNLLFQLRCVRERPGELVPVLSAFALTDAEAEVVWRQPCLDPDTATVPEPDSDVELVFDPAPDLPGTELSATYPTYWELMVVGDTNVGRYEDRFLIPVYAA